MAPVALSVTPGLRCWRQAGITHVLLDPLTADAVRGAARGVKGASSPPSTSAGAGGAGGADGHSVPAPVAAQTGAEPAPRPRERERSAPARTKPAPSRAQHTEPEAVAWSEVWQSLWVQMSASGSRPAAVWTYAELGTDLRGQADAARRQALQALIADLRMPKGSHAFWPYCLPPDNKPEPDMFSAGLTRFRPGLVLLIGDQAAGDLAALGSLPEVSLQLKMCCGMQFIRLPGLAEVSALSGPRREQLVAFIRAAIS